MPYEPGQAGLKNPQLEVVVAAVCEWALAHLEARPPGCQPVPAAAR
jgi:hypothetical protein